MLPIISDADLGHPSAPGEYPFGGATVRVDNFHIAAWQRAPSTAFGAILCTRAGDTALRFALGQNSVKPR
ncbi:MAG: hypothetical protein JWR08_1562 [Enterovirga sp.]|jgi:hypothetical protein|nr:hypothetical protein [Enterovirga sp.]